MRRVLPPVLAILIAAAVLPLRAQDVVNEAKDPHYRVLLDNAHVRILEARLPRGGQTTMHSHPDHTAYVVKGGALEFTEGTTVTPAEFKAGDALWLPGGRHSARNVGKSEFVAVITELKDSAGLKPELTTFERAELVAMLDQAAEQTRDLVARATGELWSKKPGEGRWSVSEVVEHLGLAEALILGMAQAGLAQPADPNWSAMTAGTSVGSMANWLLDRSRKAQAPEPAQPKGGMSRADALSKFGGAREVTRDFVRTTNAPVKAHSVQGPAGKMTVHQFLALIALHNMRHNLQIAEALEQLGAK